MAAGLGIVERMKILVLDAATLGLEAGEWDGFRALGELEVHQRTPYEEAATVGRCAGAEVVLTNKVPLGRGVLERLPDLKFIGVLATGYNIIDLDAARESGVAVANVPGYSTASVAQHTLALILELCHRVGGHDASVQAGDWVRSPEFSYWKQPVVELEGRTVGLVGFGAIGRRVGAAVNALGARVMASARRRRDAPGWEGFAWAEPGEIFAAADIVSLHCPQTPENTGFVDRTLLASMKPGAFFINTARGGLVNEADLAEALGEGRPAAAAVDVVSAEPMRADNPLLGAKNLVITPHMAWSSLTSRRRLLAETVENTAAFLAGKPRCLV